MAADFEQVKQNITDTIYENGEELITGQVMQDRLLEMVSVTEEAINDVTIDPTVNVTVNNTTGTPSGSASFQNNQFSFEFSGIKGEIGKSAYQIWLDAGNQGTEADFLASLQGNPASTQEYPFELENSLNGGVNKALTAEQGKVLDNKIPALAEAADDDVDLNIADPNGEVIVQFKNGHIRTKYFDSSNSSGGGSSSKSLKVLFFGNSLTQDAVACLPLLLKEIAPDLNFTIYLWYNGGQTLSAQYNTWLLDPTKNCGIFSIYSNDRSSWLNYNPGKNITWVVENCDFDILVLQEYGNTGQTNEQIKTAFTNIENWFFTNYSKAVKVVSLMDAPARLDVSGVTTRIENYNKLFFRECMSQGIIPAGLAMSYACGTSLNDLGDQGGLSPDGVHAQEGLPCLLQSYAIAGWFFDHLGMNCSIWGSKTRITQEVYTALDVPGANLGSGVITGTDEQHRIAQECAIKALKRGRALEISVLLENQSS